MYLNHLTLYQGELPPPRSRTSANGLQGRANLPRQ